MSRKRKSFRGLGKRGEFLIFWGKRDGVLRKEEGVRSGRREERGLPEGEEGGEDFRKGKDLKGRRIGGKMEEIVRKEYFLENRIKGGK